MPSDFEDVLYEKHHRMQGAAWITINRPDVRNAFRGQTVEEMIAAFNDAGQDNTVGVVVLTGAGDRAFCSGGDVRWLAEAEKEALAEGRDLSALVPHEAMRNCLKPVIARINGYAIGGGHHMAYFADLSIAAEHAMFGQVGPRVGSPASGHLVSYLIKVVGAKKAREIWYLCRRYTAQQALEMGLVNAVVPYDKLDEEVDNWCRDILAASPTCLKVLKATFEYEYEYLREQSKRNWVEELAPDFFASGEAAEGMSAFSEKREPDFAKFRR